MPQHNTQQPDNITNSFNSKKPSSSFISQSSLPDSLLLLSHFLLALMLRPSVTPLSVILESLHYGALRGRKKSLHISMEDIRFNLLESVSRYFITRSAVSSFRLLQLPEKMWLPGSEPLSPFLCLSKCEYEIYTELVTIFGRKFVFNREELLFFFRVLLVLHTPSRNIRRKICLVHRV